MPFRGTEIRTWLRDRLSTTLIDDAKDWGGYPIFNIGAPTSDIGVLARGLVDIYSRDYGLNWADLGNITDSFINCMAYLVNGVAVLGTTDRHVLKRM